MTPVAVVFDLFGTLLNIASLNAAVARYTSDAAGLIATWREKQLAYAFAATLMDRYQDFDALTALALRYAAARHGLSADDAQRQDLVAEWRRLLPFEDALPALTELRERGARCAILTNGTLSTAGAALRTSGLSDLVEVTLSVEGIGVYKPAARVYELATTYFATPAERLVFVTANGWDATGAAEFGLHAVWCNRGNAPAETFGATPAWTIRNLRELPDLLPLPHQVGVVQRDEDRP
jgi:2-haloacid dehalogenase